MVTLQFMTHVVGSMLWTQHMWSAITGDRSPTVPLVNLASNNNHYKQLIANAELE